MSRERLVFRWLRIGIALVLSCRLGMSETNNASAIHFENIAEAAGVHFVVENSARLKAPA